MVELQYVTVRINGRDIRLPVDSGEDMLTPLELLYLSRGIEGIRGISTSTSTPRNGKES